MSGWRRWAAWFLLRRAGWGAAWTKAVVVILTFTLLLNMAGSGLTRGTWPDLLSWHQAQDAPDQRWGSAADQAHVVGGSGNRKVPATVRSRYPLRPAAAAAAAPGKRNTARLVDPPAPKAVTGFDAKTSRELPARRGARQRGYLNADGTETTTFSADPVNFWNGTSRAWQPIDSRLLRTGDSGWRNTADAVDVRLAERADAGQIARLGIDARHAVAFGVAGAKAVAGDVDGSTVMYRDALPGGGDVRLESAPGSVKETLVIDSPDAPTRYVFPLRLTGLTPRLAGGQVQLLDEAGRRRAVIPAGFMWDSAQDPARSDGVRYRLVTADGGPALEVSLDAAWLKDPDRVFPLMVDPTVATGGTDSTMVVRQGTASIPNSSELLVGRENGNAAATYLKFGGLVSRLQGHTIFGARLSVVNFNSASCRARRVSVHPVTQSWTAGTGTSYPGPDVGGALTSKSFAYGFVGLGQPRSSCPVKSTLFNLGDGGRKLVQGWANGGANNGLSLRASATDDLAWKRFTGSGTANPPTLYVTHSPYNAKYSIPNPVPEPPVLQNQSGKVKVTVTNKSAETWTPSTYYLAYRAYNAATGKAVMQKRAANLPSNVARDAKVTLEATIQPLPPGRYFLDFTMVHTGGPVFTDEQVPPARIVLQVIDIPPIVQELYPPNGYQTPTLAPLLWAQAIDIDAPAGSSLQYKFEVCDNDTAGNPVNCTTSAYQSSPTWAPPVGRLVWSKTYQWRAFVKDATTEIPSPYSTLITAVPQPAVTSNVAGAPTGSREREFDPQSGNFTTAASDASAASVGVDLNVMRTYNSLDPRSAPDDLLDPALDAPFGAGWRTQFDMRLTPDDDGSGNVLVSYPDGQEVRFGKNPDGTYAAPMGRKASLTFNTTPQTWTLKDTSGKSFEFLGTGELLRISDLASHRIVLSYTGGKLTKAQVDNGQSNRAGRALFFTWTGGHVTSVRTDPVNGQALEWTYTYTGDLLTQVCAPGAACTKYEYAPGSHYRSAVLDDKPESYWRLGESTGQASAGSEVAVNLGADHGTYRNVTLAAPGVVAGSQDTAASFAPTADGVSHYVDLPKGTVKKSRDGAVELWFKSTATGSGGPLLGYQDKAIGTASTIGAPILYHGTDGRLHGQFWNGTAGAINGPVVSFGEWHHVVLTQMGTTQSLFVDGVKVGTATTPANVDVSKLTFNQIGAAYTPSPASYPGYGTASLKTYNGSIDEVAVYNHPLASTAVKAHYLYGSNGSDQLTKITLPSGRVAAEVAYDDATARVSDYTDRDGGTWKVGTSMVYGGNTDLRRGVEVRDPGNRPWLYEYDAISGQMIRSGSPTSLVMKEEDQADWTPPTEEPSPPPTQVCASPDPGDPQFCTVIPPDSEGPVFEGHNLDGMAIRSFSYDDHGFMTSLTNENGHTVTMTNDDRGNVTSRRTCRTPTECHTEYFTFPASPGDPLDPVSNLATAQRDARSTSATDTRFMTSFTYHFTGQAARQSFPNNTSVVNTYSIGSEFAADGAGTIPTGLVLTTTDPRGAVTRYGYYVNGDLAKVTAPSGLVTTFTYDAIGRMTSKKEVSDTFPSGVVTLYTYDGHSRMTSQTDPVTTDAITDVSHQRKTTTGYDPDGNVTSTTVDDLLGGDAARTTTNTYDDHGRLERTTDALGNETSYTFDAFGNMRSMVDANGNQYEYGYTARDQIAEVRLRDWSDDPEGAPEPEHDYLVLHSYAYDFGGRMARDIDAMGRRTEYAYYDDDLTKSVTLKDFHNPDGTTRDFVLESNTYDGAGNLTRQVGGNGQIVTENTINPSGTLAATVVDPAGLARRTAYTYDGNENVTKVATSGRASNVPWAMPATAEEVTHTYDLAGRLTQEKQTVGTTSLITSHTYDQRGLETSVTDPRGNVAGADKAAFTTTVTNDELGRQTTVTGPAVPAESNGGAAQNVTPTARIGHNTFDEPVNTQDELGNITRTGVDLLGRPSTVTMPAYTPPGGSPITPVTRTSYDGLGNVTESVDPAGNTTRFSYDRLNRMTRRDEPAATNDDRAIWDYTYTRTGEVLSVTDPTGARVQTTYDDLDRPVTLTQVEREPVADNFTTRHAYNDAGNLISETSPSGAVTSNTYDKVGELTQTEDPSGVLTTYGYDFTGRLVRETDGLGRTARTGYDGFGRLASEQDLKPDLTPLRSQTYGYDPAGNLTTATDPNQHITRYEYDAANQLTRQTEPVSDTESISTGFGYDAAGNRSRYTDGRGEATIFTVNSLGLPESVIEPSTQAHPNTADRTWTAAYNARGNPVTLTAPGGVTQNRTFDAAGRITSETGAGAEAATAARTRGYDAAGRLIEVNAPGGDNTYTYNDRGGMLTATGPSGDSGFTYDADGQPTQRTDAAGTTTFGYTKSRLSTVTDGITGVTETLAYDPAGDIKSVDYGAGRIRSFGYDDFGRLATDELNNGGGQAVGSIRYGYDLNNHLTSKNTTGTAGAADNTYTYDQAGRITSWTQGNVTTDYGWDASGNLTRNGAKTATYDERNRLRSDGDATYTHTPRGTIATKTSGGATEAFSFDAFDRLINEGGTGYTYDGLDRVATRGPQTFTYAGQENDPVTDGTASYARDPAGKLIAVAEAGKQRLTLTDNHSDVIADFDPTDTTLATGLPDSAAYDPFGKVIAETTDGQTTGGDTAAGVAGNAGYQGDWTDPGTGKVNMGARWYDPNTAGFISRDTVTYTRGDSVLANKYTYAAAASLDHIDPDGNWPTINQPPCAECFPGRSPFGGPGYYEMERIRESQSGAGGGTSNSPGRGSGGGGIDWAKRKAEQARKARIARQREVTRRARQAIERAAKTKPLKPQKAATKPLYSNTSKVIKGAAHMPAQVTSLIRNVVADTTKQAQDLYHTALEAEGDVLGSISDAVRAASEWVQQHKADIAGFAAGLLVGIGCGVLIGWTGIGAVACGALAGAVGSLVHDLVEGGHSWQEMALNAGKGALFGAAFGGFGSVAGAGLRAGLTALGRSGAQAATSGLRGAASAAASAGRREAADILAGRITSGRLSRGGLLGRIKRTFSGTPPTAYKPNATVRDLESFEHDNLDDAGNWILDPEKMNDLRHLKDQNLLDSVFTPTRLDKWGSPISVDLRDRFFTEGNHRAAELLERARDGEYSITLDTPIYIRGFAGRD